MATAKKTVKRSRTKSTPVSQKSPLKREKKDAALQVSLQKTLPTTEHPKVHLERFDLQDLSHSQGHRKINLKKVFSETTGGKSKSQNPSALNFSTGSERVLRAKSAQRRIISGASINRKGRLNNNTDKEP